MNGQRDARSRVAGLPTMLTIKETARVLRVHPNTVRNLIRDKRLRAVQLVQFGRWRIPEPALAELMKTRTQ
jgi:excisionase family DNA binding protein